MNNNATSLRRVKRDQPTDAETETALREFTGMRALNLADFEAEQVESMRAALRAALRAVLLSATSVTTDRSSSEVMTGQIRGLAFEDGEPRGIDCGLEDCECPEHDDSVRPAGTYITIRLDGEPPIGLWPVRVERIVEREADRG